MMRQSNFAKQSNRYNVIREVSEDWAMNYDLLRFCLGDKIANGQFREVFEWGFRKDVVCKVAYNPQINFTESSVWGAIKDSHYAKWFAPIIGISPCGHFLLMRRVRMITDKDKLPRTIPDMLTDVKKENFGFIGKQLVCIDYQFISRAFDLAANVQQKKLVFD